MGFYSSGNIPTGQVVVLSYFLVGWDTPNPLKNENSPPTFCKFLKITSQAKAPRGQGQSRQFFKKKKDHNLLHNFVCLAVIEFLSFKWTDGLLCIIEIFNFITLKFCLFVQQQDSVLYESFHASQVINRDSEKWHQNDVIK